MAILGIGVDLVHIPRIASLVNRRGPIRLASRILSPDELVQWQSLSSPAVITRFLAVRWAVKEAAYKALYPTVTTSWKEFSYQTLDAGRPSLRYHPHQPENAEKVGRMHVSVSHDGDYVFTSVLAEGVLHTAGKPGSGC